jgi:hypothetical protein
MCTCTPAQRRWLAEWSWRGGNLGIRSRTCTTATLPTTKPPGIIQKPYQCFHDQMPDKTRPAILLSSWISHLLQNNLSEVRWWNYGTRQNSLVFVRLVMLVLCQEMKTEYIQYAKYTMHVRRWKGKRMLITKYMSFVSSLYVCALPLTQSASTVLSKGYGWARTQRCRYKTTCGLQFWDDVLKPHGKLFTENW